MSKILDEMNGKNSNSSTLKHSKDKENKRKEEFTPQPSTKNHKQQSYLIESPPL